MYAIRSYYGSQISSVNNRGVAAVTGGIIDINDMHRALEAAQAVNIPHRITSYNVCYTKLLRQ